MSGEGGGERGSGPEGRGDAELRARLERLQSGLDQQRDAAPLRGAPSSAEAPNNSALGRAFRLSTEFVAGIIAGGLLGWGFDALVGSRPWGMIVFVMLGFAAGIYNVMRASGFLTPPSGPHTN